MGNPVSRQQDGRTDRVTGSDQERIQVLEIKTSVRFDPLSSIIISRERIFMHLQNRSPFERAKSKDQAHLNLRN
jgi:hypothetical protein